MRKKVDKSLQMFKKLEDIYNSNEVIPLEISNSLNRVESLYLIEKANKELVKLGYKGIEADLIYRKMSNIYNETTKNKTWHLNHARITMAYYKLLSDYNRMPTICEVVNNCNLSRQTVHEHLKEFDKSPYYNEINQQFKIIAFSVLEKMAIEANKGNVKAGRLFLEATGNLKPIIQHQQNTNKNYIQLNDCTINLNEEQSKKILELLEKSDK